MSELLTVVKILSASGNSEFRTQTKGAGSFAESATAGANVLFHAVVETAEIVE